MLDWLPSKPYESSVLGRQAHTNASAAFHACDKDFVALPAPHLPFPSKRYQLSHTHTHTHLPMAALEPEAPDQTKGGLSQENSSLHKSNSTVVLEISEFWAVLLKLWGT